MIETSRTQPGVGHGFSRREWLAAAASGLCTLAPACHPRILGAPRGLAPDAGPALPEVRASGSPHEIGVALGRSLAGAVREVLTRRAAWVAELRAIAAGLPRSALEAMEAAAARYAPEGVSHLRGLASGSGAPYADLWRMNHWSELWALSGKLGRLSDELPGGCSTIALVAGRRILLAHNEDGDPTYEGRMALGHLRPEGAPGVLTVIYPGFLPGNAPFINDRGLAMTSNFIPALYARPGVGRFFLDHLAQRARTVDEALAVVGHPARALSCHHVIARAAEGRLVAMEATPGRMRVQPVQGIYLHTNHLVLGSLAAVPQAGGAARASTRTRLEVLERWRARQRAVRDTAALIDALSSHEGAPLSPCRHATAKLPTATLVTALFSLPDRGMTLYPRQPCLGHARWHSI